MEDKHLCLCRIPRKESKHLRKSKKVRFIVVNHSEFVANQKDSKYLVTSYRAEMSSGFNMIAWIDAQKNIKKFCEENGYTIVNK